MSEISEESLNHFLDGMCIAHIFCYSNVIQIWFSNGSFLSISSDDELRYDLRGPDPPEQEQLRESWDEKW
jgi:hypothetical protein